MAWHPLAERLGGASWQGTPLPPHLQLLLLSNGCASLLIFSCRVLQEVQLRSSYCFKKRAAC